jgi:hypothetical protein
MRPSISRFKIVSSLRDPDLGCILIVALFVLFDPIGCSVLELFRAIQDKLSKVARYNEGYSMSPGKEIGSQRRF